MGESVIEDRQVIVSRRPWANDRSARIEIEMTQSFKDRRRREPFVLNHRMALM